MRVVGTARYTCKPGTREQMLEEIRACGVEEIFRAYPECQVYNYSYSATDPDAVDLCDVWATKESFERHLLDPVCKITAEIRGKYVLDRRIFVTMGEEYQK